MMHILDVTSIFPPESNEKKDIDFRNSIEGRNHIREFIEGGNKQEVFDNTLNQIRSHILNDIDKSLKVQKSIVKQSTTYGETLLYSQMTYDERTKEMLEHLTGDMSGILDEIQKKYHSVPDHMGVADAKNRLGRPFLYEYLDIDDEQEKPGVVHIVAVYGSVTESQVKNLVGFPDLAVVKTTFGFYLWDTTNHIQMFFLKKCTNSNAIGTLANYLFQWLKTSGEEINIINRARARLKILKVLKEAATVK